MENVSIKNLGFFNLKRIDFQEGQLPRLAKGIFRFLKYNCVGGSTFVIDLVLVFILMGGFVWSSLISRVSVGVILGISGIDNLFKDSQRDYLSVKKSNMSRIPGSIKSKFQTQKEINGYVLLQEK